MSGNRQALNVGDTGGTSQTQQQQEEESLGGGSGRYSYDYDSIDQSDYDTGGTSPIDQDPLTTGGSDSGTSDGGTSGGDSGGGSTGSTGGGTSPISQDPLQAGPSDTTQQQDTGTDVSGQGPGAAPSEPDRLGDASRQEIGAVIEAGQQSDRYSAGDLTIENNRITPTRDAQERVVAEQFERQLEGRTNQRGQQLTGQAPQAPGRLGPRNRRRLDVDFGAGSVTSRTGFVDRDTDPRPVEAARTGPGATVGTGAQTGTIFELSESGQQELEQARLERARLRLNELTPGFEVTDEDVARTEQGGFTLSQQGRGELEQLQERRQRAGEAVDQYRFAPTQADINEAASAQFREGYAQAAQQFATTELPTVEQQQTDPGTPTGEQLPEQPDFQPLGDSPDFSTVLGAAGGSLFDVDVSDLPTNIGQGAAQNVAPSARMTLGPEGTAARGAREDVFAERAEAGFENLVNRQDVSVEQAGAMFFQAGEIGERAFMDLGRGTADVLDATFDLGAFGVSAVSNPFAAGARLQTAGAEFGEGDVGEGFETLGGGTPSVFGEDLGEVPGNIAEGVFGGIGMGVGGVSRFPVTATADLTGDTRTQIRDLAQPQIRTPADVSPDATDAELRREIAALNPGVDAEDVTVTRSSRQVAGREREQVSFDVDLDERDVREQIAAQDPDVDPGDVRFRESGDPFAAVISEEGETPSAITGPFGQFERTAESQVELFQERPISTAALFALPFLEGVPAGVRGYRAARGAKATVRLEDIAQPRTVEGGDIPRFETATDAPTSRAVRELETRAADQPEALQEAAGTESILFHTTGERFGTELTVGEGASELPGLFTAGDLNPVGLRRSQVVASERASLRERLTPSRPNVRTQPERVAAFEGDQIAGMPEWATGSGMELRRASDGTVVERGLSRFEAQRRAEASGDLVARPRSDTLGFRFLTEEAEPGTAQVRPRGSRTTEQEAIFPPESRFAETGRFAVELPSGELAAGDIFQRAARQGERQTRGATRQGGEVRTATEISRRSTTSPQGGTGVTAFTYGTAFGGAGGAFDTAPLGADGPTSVSDVFGVPESAPTTAFESATETGLFGEPTSGFRTGTETGTETTTGTQTATEPATGRTTARETFGETSTGTSRGTGRDTSSTRQTTRRDVGVPTGGMDLFFGSSSITTTGRGDGGRGGTPFTGDGTGMFFGGGGDTPPREQFRRKSDEDDDADDEPIFGEVLPEGTRYVNPVASASQFLFGTALGDSFGGESQAENILPGGEGTPTQLIQSGQREVQDPFDFGL